MRVLVAVLSLACWGLAAASTFAPAPLLTTAAALMLLTRPALTGSLRSAARSLLPGASFAIACAGAAVAGRGDGLMLGLRTGTVFLLATTGSRLWPLEISGAWVRPGSSLAPLVLTWLMARHFARIFSCEAGRVLRARRLQTGVRLGPGSARSLTFAIVAIAERTLVRAERFYAAQRVRGLGA